MKTEIQHNKIETNVTAFHRLVEEGNSVIVVQAAAPDLLEALQFLLADYIAISGPELTGSSEPANRALAAIAKAKALLKT